MRRGLDPQRHERDFVHQPCEQLVVRVLRLPSSPPSPPFLPVPPFLLLLSSPATRKQPRRVILNTQNVPVLQPLSTDEGIRACVEFETQEVGRRNELRLAGLTDQAGDVGRRVRRQRICDRRPTLVGRLWAGPYK